MSRSHSGTRLNPGCRALGISLAIFLVVAVTGWVGVVAAAPRQFLLKWGGYGNADGQFLAVRGIARDPNGQIFVVDNDRCRIQSFSEEGKLLSAWGSYGDGSQQFRGPSDIAVDSGGNIFVADYAGFRIKKFSHDGTLLAEWQDPPESPASPFYLAIDSQDNVYVTTDRWFTKFDNLGKLIYRVFPAVRGLHLYGIAIGPSGTVYVANRSGDMVLKYDAAGDSIGWWSTAAVVGGRYPLGITVDAQEHILVATATWSVVEYPPDGGTPIDEWTSYGYGDGQFSYPWDITLDAHGDFYVTDANRDDVQKFGDATVPVLRSSWGALKRRFR